MLQSTYTFVVLELSPAAFDEIHSKLKAAGYDHAFHVEQDRTVIDMHGIAVAPQPVNKRDPNNPSGG